MNKIILMLAVWFVSSLAASGQVFSHVTVSASNSYEVSAIETINHVFVAAWMEDRAGHPVQPSLFDKQIAVSVSLDYGLTWSEKTVFDDLAYSGSGNPSLCTDENGNIYLVFMTPIFLQEGKFELYKSINNGSSWIHMNVPLYEPNAMPDLPHLTVKNNTITIAYTEYSAALETSIKYVRSDDGGTNWTEPALISTVDDNSCLGSYMNRGYDGTLLISWGHFNQPQPLLLAKSPDEGMHFKLPVIATASNHDNYVTQLVCSPNSAKIGVLYWVVHEFGLVYYVGSDDYGLTWNLPVQVASNGNLPSAGFDANDYLHITYTDTTSNDSVAFRYACSKDNGISFSTRATIVDNALIGCSSQYIGASSATFTGSDNQVHSFWIDWRTGTSKLLHTYFDPGFVSMPEIRKLSPFKAYPNPASGRINIIGTEDSKSKLFIYNCLGELMIEKDLCRGANVIDVSSFSAGLYILKMKGTSFASEERLVIK
jgi:hypothetical protein